MTRGKAATSIDDMTPAELRKEADRRELVEKARGLAVRHDARVRLVQTLHAMDRTVVDEAQAHDVMRAAVLAIIEAEKAEHRVTNGDVNMAGFGAPEDWWENATADFPKRDHPDLLDEIERRRTSAW